MNDTFEYVRSGGERINITEHVTDYNAIDDDSIVHTSFGGRHWTMWITHEIYTDYFFPHTFPVLVNGNICIAVWDLHRVAGSANREGSYRYMVATRDASEPPINDLHLSDETWPSVTWEFGGTTVTYPSTGPKNGKA